jgi:PAS domain S-box-containing protein
LWWFAVIVVMPFAIVWLGTGLNDERAARRQSELRLERIVNSSPVAQLMVDDDGVISMFNPSAEELFGWTASEVIGKQPFVDLLAAPVRDEYAGIMRQVVTSLQKSREPWQMTRRRIRTQAMHRDGSGFEIEMTIRAITYGDHVEFVVAMRDVHAPVTESGPLAIPAK